MYPGVLANWLSAQTLAGRARSLIVADAGAGQLRVGDGGAVVQVWKALQLLHNLEEHMQVGLAHKNRKTPSSKLVYSLNAGYGIL